ncbi:MAG: LLM class flavin-dependent oxidoreductase [Dehalococcoidia bacterium]|nr:LLM class flavin-dependent oxidoreductase [Dehalococcoidia bacterium]
MVHLGVAGLQRGIRHPEPLLSLVQAAEQLGFDSVWFNEQHFSEGLSGAPSALLLAAASLARTSTIRVGLSVVVLPLYHPVLLAEALAQLDELGSGRLDVGIGRGSSPGLSRAVPDDLRRAAFFEAHDLLLKAWSSPAVSAEGACWRFADLPVTLRPAQPLPIFVAGASYETIAFAAARGYRLLLSLEPPEQRQLALLEKARQALGVEGPRRVSFSRYVCIGRTPAEAKDLAVRLWQAVQDRRRALARERGQPFRERPFAEFCAEQAIIGDGAGCRRALEQLIAEQGADHFRFVFNGNGALSAEETLMYLERFASAVLHHPEFRAWRANGSEKKGARR